MTAKSYQILLALCSISVLYETYLAKPLWFWILGDSMIVELPCLTAKLRDLPPDEAKQAFIYSLEIALVRQIPGSCRFRFEVCRVEFRI